MGAVHPAGAGAEELESLVDELYRNRFSRDVLARRSAVWKELCDRWFSKYIPHDARVLEVAAGYCEFINNIGAANRVAVDLNPETKLHAASGVEVHRAPAERMSESLEPGSFDTVFMSNFLEHCRSRDHVLAVLKESATMLRPNGRLLILGPNFRYCYKEYYDYFDHHLALNDKAVVEAMHLAGFDVEQVYPRTLPFTFRGPMPSWPWLVRLYVQMPWVWPLFGKQFFLVGRKLPRVPSLRFAARRAA